MNIDYIDHTKHLPFDVISIIVEFLPIKIKYLINKSYYETNHKYIIPISLNIKFNIYIDKLLFNDYDFIFNRLLNDNLQKWLFIKKFRFSGMEFKNYLYYLLFYADKQNAIKCYKLINSSINTLYNTGLNGKLHKNKRINRDIVWTK